MAFVSAGAFDQEVGTVNLTPTLTNATAGSVNVLFTQHNNSAAQAGANYFFPSSYQLMFSATSINHRAFVHIAPCSGTESTLDTLTIATSGGTTGTRHFSVVFNFSNATTVWESSGLASGASRAVTDSPVTTLGPNRTAINIIGIGQSSGSSDLAGETGGTWSLDYAIDASLAPVVSLYSANMATADTISGGAYTMAASAVWVAAGFALIAPVTETPSFMTFDSRVFISPLFDIGHGS